MKLRGELAAEVVANARTQATLDRVMELDIADRVEIDPAGAAGDQARAMQTAATALALPKPVTGGLLIVKPTDRARKSGHKKGSPARRVRDG